MKDIKIIYNEKIYENYYDLLVHKITDETYRKQIIMLKNDCIILTNEEGTLYNHEEKDFLLNLEVIKSHISYKIHPDVHGIYIFPSSDYKFYFLDKQEPLKSRNKGIKHITHIILLRMYKWNINYGNRNIDLIPKLFSNIEIDQYIIKPNTVLTIDEKRNVVFTENINTVEIIDKFQESFF